MHVAGQQVGAQVCLACLVVRRVTVGAPMKACHVVKQRELGTADCVRQAFNLQAGACSYVSRQVVQGNEEAPGILTATCDDIVRVWTATENLPTHKCALHSLPLRS